MGRFLRDRFAGPDIGAEARYRADLISKLQSFHMAGAEAALEEIFVAPRLLVPQSGLSEAELLETGTQALHYLWPDLATGVATIPPPSATLSELLTHGRRVLVSGRPGTGKSTLLAYCAILWAGGVQDGRYETPSSTLPVFFHLGDLESHLADSDRTSVSASDPLEPMRTALEESGMRTRGMDDSFAAAANEGRLILLIDGWDDLPDKGLGHSGRWLRECLRRFPNTRVLMSGPTKGYGPLMRLGFVVTGLLPWRRGQAIEAGRRLAQARGAGSPPDLSSYWRPGQSPLTTVLRALSISRAQSAVSQQTVVRPAALLRDYVDHALQALAEQAEVNDFEPQLKGAIQQAAYIMVKDGAWELPADTLAAVALTDASGQVAAFQGRRRRQLLSSLASSGLFAGTPESIRFQSPIVRDYLAAMHIIEQGKLAEVGGRANNGRWAHILRICVGTAGLQNLAPYLAAPKQPDSRLYQSASWLAETPGDEPWRESVLIGLGKRCMDANQPSITRQRAASALAVSDAPGVDALMGQLIRQHKTAMRQMALAGLARIAPVELVEAAPRLMLDSHATVRAAAVHALAWAEERQVEDKLLDALYDNDLVIARAAAEGMALNGDQQSCQALRDAAMSRAFGARRASRAGLRLVDEPWAQELLTKSVTTDGLATGTGPLTNVPDDVGGEPGTHWKRSRAGDQSWLVSWAIAQGRIVPVGKAAIPLLLEALRDNEASVRQKVAATLGQLAILDGVEALREAESDESPEVREAATIAIVKIGRAWNTDV